MWHLSHSRLKTRRLGLWLSAWALVFGMLLAYVASLAEPNLDKMQPLASQRYGAGAAQTVAAWRQLIEESRALSDNDKVNKVNTFFNRRIQFKSDLEVYKQEDYWATPLEFMGNGAGDCEDFSISKYMTLQILGISNEHLRLVYVRYKVGSTAPIAHMVLGYYPQPTEEPLILDNMISSVRPASMRSDLTPVFSFNSEGLWVPGATASAADPTARLSQWRNVLTRMREEGL